MSGFYGQFLQWGLALIVIALVLTVIVFRKRWFERGPQPGKPADAAKIKRENPPDEWSRTH